MEGDECETADEVAWREEIGQKKGRLELMADE
jgi:hypothetical protein